MVDDPEGFELLRSTIIDSLEAVKSITTEVDISHQKIDLLIHDIRFYVNGVQALQERLEMVRGESEALNLLAERILRCLAFYFENILQLGALQQSIIEFTKQNLKKPFGLQLVPSLTTQTHTASFGELGIRADLNRLEALLNSVEYQLEGAEAGVIETPCEIDEAQKLVNSLKRHLDSDTGEASSSYARDFLALKEKFETMVSIFCVEREDKPLPQHSDNNRLSSKGKEAVDDTDDWEASEINHDDQDLEKNGCHVLKPIILNILSTVKNKYVEKDEAFKLLSATENELGSILVTSSLKSVFSDKSYIRNDIVRKLLIEIQQCLEDKESVKQLNALKERVENLLAISEKTNRTPPIPYTISSVETKAELDFKLDVCPNEIKSSLITQLKAIQFRCEENVEFSKHIDVVIKKLETTSQTKDEIMTDLTNDIWLEEFFNEPNPILIGTRKAIINYVNDEKQPVLNSSYPLKFFDSNQDAQNGVSGQNTSLKLPAKERHIFPEKAKALSLIEEFEGDENDDKGFIDQQTENFKKEIEKTKNVEQLGEVLEQYMEDTAIGSLAISIVEAIANVAEQVELNEAVQTPIPDLFAYEANEMSGPGHN